MNSGQQHEAKKRGRNPTLSHRKDVNLKTHDDKGEGKDEEEQDYRDMSHE